MQLRYNYRVYPTSAQQEALARAFGCARVVFNDGLRIRQHARQAGLPYVSDGELSKRVITEAKKTPEPPGRPRPSTSSSRRRCRAARRSPTAAGGADRPAARFRAARPG